MNAERTKAGSENILLVQLGDIGDVVLTTPTIRAFKETWPQSRVAILVRKPCGTLLAADPHLNEVVELETGCGFLFRTLRAARYDLVVDLRTGDRGACLSFLTGARERVGCHAGGKQFWHDLLFTTVIRNLRVAPPPVHPGADQSLRVVRAIGVDTTNSTPRLHLASQDRERAAALLSACGGLQPPARWVTINPFARWKYKEWDAEKWTQVLDYVWQQHGMPSVLVGSPSESQPAQMLLEGRGSYVFNLAGKTTLGELAALISMSTLHLGVDSAAPHIAAAVSTPTITIHGPTDWRSWRVADDHHKVVTLPLDCVPCNRKGCDDTEKSRCLNELPVETVMTTVDEMLTI
jgi:heptosyltransferase-3